MLYDIEPQTIDDFLILKFIFSKHVSSSYMKRTMEIFTETLFYDELKVKFKVATVACFRDRKDVVVKFEDQTEETEQEIIDRFKDAMKAVVEN